MKKKFLFSGAATVLLASVLWSAGGTVYGEEAGYQEVESGVFSVTDSSLQSPLKSKASEYALENRALTDKDKQAIQYIEEYVTNYLNLHPAKRGLIEDVIDSAVVELAFDTAFKRDSVLFGLIGAFSGSEEKPYTDWYNGLTNTSERYQTVFDVPTGQNVRLRARYIDNGSNQTVVVHSGYRDEPNSNLTHVKMFSDMGYNVLIPDTRSHGESEGKYITFGYYEKSDLTGWINQEVQEKAEQEIILFGISMGAATTILSQETPHPSVKAYIEDCGYASLEQEFHDILSLITQYFEYIPILKEYDWDAKETKLINKLNEDKTKPILKMDIYSVMPINTVDKTGVPKLFIHGDADWFIPPVSLEQLYNRAIGYKEKLIVPGAEHGQSIYVDGPLYTTTVQSFLEKVEGMTVKNPVVAPDSNLLKNTDFTATETGFIDWSFSTDGQNFSNNPVGKNGLGEFVLKKALLSDMVTVIHNNEGLRFFNRQTNNLGFVGQDISVKAGQVYELSLAAKNNTDALITYPNVLYGIDTQLNEEGLEDEQIQNKAVVYQATADGAVKVKLGAKLGYKSLISRDYTITTLSNVQVVNADWTPPAAPEITDISVAGTSCTITGVGEPETTILIEANDGTVLASTETNEAGEFQLTISKEQHSLLHVINKDYKGNQSESRVIVFQ